MYPGDVAAPRGAVTSEPVYSPDSVVCASSSAAPCDEDEEEEDAFQCKKDYVDIKYGMIT